MTGAGVRRWVLPAALIAVVLVIVQFFAQGVGEASSAAESRTAPATAPYAHCGDETDPEETSEHFRARGRPNCRDLTPDSVVRTGTGTVTSPDGATPAQRPVVCAYPESRPAGRELPALFQVFRC
ncbi:hypothetical protein [Streptomyces sp. MZ04]|uniref:hypothetical protein n=1 Tax=Streptomyces sp. MZ04 TaxID=2559236 RepID=UPI00107EC16D|nr:hypothetical protein [Streptomyces sp. MZ04]TGA84643.1 hypothetical protein E2651_42375 [Streptomyces sp. MZ04]